MKRSQALRLLRHGCNCAELAAWFGIPTIDATRAVRLLEICVKRRLALRHRPALAA